MATNKQESVFLAVGYCRSEECEVTSSVHGDPEDAIEDLQDSFDDIDVSTIQVIEYTPIESRMNRIGLKEAKKLIAK